MSNFPAYSVAALMLLSAQAQALNTKDSETNDALKDAIVKIAPTSNCTTVNFSVISHKDSLGSN